MSANVLKAGIGYTVANVLIKGIAFLTLPIFSRVLDTHDFGVYNVFVAYDAILYCVVGFALHSSVRSANWQFPGKIDEYVSSISIIYILNMALLILLAAVFGTQLSALMGLDAIVIACLVVHSFGSALVTLYNARVSLQYSYKKYMAVAAASSLGNVALSLILVFTLFHSQRYLGRILGATVALAILSVVLIALFWKRAKPRINLTFWKFGMRYSLPVVPHGLSQVVLSQFDRLMVNYMVSTEAAGVYGLAANLMIVLNVLTDSISTVWSTWFYETMEGESADKATATKRLMAEQLEERCAKVQSRGDVFMRAFAVLAIGIMAVAPELVWILGGDAYMDGTYCAFGMVLSGFCVFIYNLIVIGEYYKQDTRSIMVATMGAAAINFALNLFAIQAFGYIAAAYTTLVSYVLYVSFHWRVSERLLGFSVLRLKSLMAVAGVLVCSLVWDVIAIYCLPARVAAGLAFGVLIAMPLIRGAGGLAGIKIILRK